MAKRITRVMADDAARKLAKIAYGQKIIDARKERKDFGDYLIKKYIPKPVLDCCNEFGDYFEKFNAFFVTAFVDDWNMRREVPCNISNPTRKYIIAEKQDIFRDKELSTKIYDLEQLYNDYIGKVSDALYCLKSEVKIKEFFPEALPYLDFSETNLPSTNYSNLRQLLK